MNDNFCLRLSSWIALLSIAHRYEIQSVHKRAIREIYDRHVKKYRKSQQRLNANLNAAPMFSAFTIQSNIVVASSTVMMDSPPISVAEVPNGPDSEGDSDSELDYVMLISAAEKYDVPLQYVSPCFVELVMREEPLTEAEVVRLSTSTVCNFGRAREAFLRRTVGRPARNSLFSDNQLEVANTIVRDIWAVASN
jgi:hypothetical protein